MFCINCQGNNFEPNNLINSISDAMLESAPIRQIFIIFLFGATNKTVCLALPEINNSEPQGPDGFQRAD
jgi:hypothetical protein